MPNARKRTRGVHTSIKTALGYSAYQDDQSVLADWKQRMTRVCKPCWELKYCPYGPLVEQSPMLPSVRKDATEHRNRLKEALQAGVTGELRQLTAADHAQYTEWLADERLLLHQAIHEIHEEERMKEINQAKSDQDKIDMFLGGTLPPIHIYRTSFDDGPEEEVDQESYSPGLHPVSLTPA